MSMTASHEVQNRMRPISTSFPFVESEYINTPTTANSRGTTMVNMHRRMGRGDRGLA